MKSESGTTGGRNGLPDDIAAEAGLPSQDGRRDLHEGETGHSGRPSLDPHDKAQDYGFRPEGSGRGTGSAGGSRDFGLQPDLHGEHDPVVNGPPGYASTADDRSEGLQAKAADLADRARQGAADLIGDAREHAADARDYAADKVEQARARAGEVYRDTRDRVSETLEDRQRQAVYMARRGRVHLRRRQSEVEAFVHENPLLVGVVGVAAGLLLGSLLPRTRSEDRSIGPYADELRAQGLSYAREAADRGRDFVRHTLDPDNIQTAAERAGIDPKADHASAGAPDERKLHNL